MYVARILYPVEVLGYGKRIGIWFSGCPHKCVNCSNPELWESNLKQFITLDNLMSIIKRICLNNTVDGFTITGGEPFYQKDDLEKLVEELYKINDDILIYSGYTLEDLKEMKNESILSRIAVLIDGRYIDSQNNGAILKGSDNQNIYILNNKYELKYDLYLQNTVNAIQNFNIGNGVISVGIHKPDFKNKFENSISEKGLEKK